MERQTELADLRKNWKPPSELSGAEREVRLAPGGVAIATLAVVFFLTSIVAVVGLSKLAARRTADIELLREQGQEIEAVITRHWRAGGKDNPSKIAYEFQYGGSTYRTSRNTPHRIWETLHVGDRIAVRFLPAQPTLSHPAAWEDEPMPKWVPGLMGATLAGCALLMLFVLRREYRLLAEGRPAPARITAHHRVKNGQMVRYEFAPLDGGVIKGRSNGPRRPPAVGSVVTILYDRDNPRRNTLYPTRLVRLARD